MEHEIWGDASKKIGLRLVDAVCLLYGIFIQGVVFADCVNPQWWQGQKRGGIPHRYQCGVVKKCAVGKSPKSENLQVFAFFRSGA